MKRDSNRYSAWGSESQLQVSLILFRKPSERIWKAVGMLRPQMTLIWAAVDTNSLNKHTHLKETQVRDPEQYRDTSWHTCHPMNGKLWRHITIQNKRWSTKGDNEKEATICNSRPLVLSNAGCERLSSCCFGNWTGNPAAAHPPQPCIQRNMSYARKTVEYCQVPFKR